MPQASSSTEGTSSGARSNPSKFSSEKMAKATTSAVRHATITKSMRQPTESTSTPEREGPMAGAKLIISPTMPMAAPRFSRGKMSKIKVKTMGMTTPVPKACKMRPSKSMGNAGAQAATTAPAAKSAMPDTKSLRVEKRPIKNAFIGMITASTSEYPEVRYCTVVWSTPMSPMMWGRAGERKVAHKTTSTAPAKSTATMSFCCLVNPFIVSFLSPFVVFSIAWHARGARFDAGQLLYRMCQIRLSRPNLAM